MIGFWTWGNIWDESTTWRGDLAFGEQKSTIWYEGHRKKITCFDS